jgi:hypothetical protein
VPSAHNVVAVLHRKGTDDIRKSRVDTQFPMLIPFRLVVSESQLADGRTDGIPLMNSLNVRRENLQNLGCWCLRRSNCLSVCVCVCETTSVCSLCGYVMNRSHNVA